MSKIIQELIQFFALKQESALEMFINSKQPTSAAEVEYWTREYELTDEGMYWGRGL